MMIETEFLYILLRISTLFSCAEVAKEVGFWLPF
jgi:hypothetical protein